jgi:chemotaxis protein methyltransferase CheR
LEQNTEGHTPNYKKIQEFLFEVEKRYALQPSQNMELRLNRMCAAQSDKETTELLQRLRTLPADHPEWLLFVEELTVHETYFGRDRNAMNALRNIIIPQILKNKKNRELNIWSAGCSTGEEAYNLAILALEAIYYFETKCHGPVPDNFCKSHMWKINIIGTDLSTQVLRTAKIGIYNDSIMGSFRSTYNEVLPYFTIDHCDINDRGKKTIYYKIKDYFKTIVTFTQRNLFTKIPHLRSFDLILCRNVMIYFNDQN